MSLRLLKTPGIFQPRRGMCCLACGLKSVGVQPWLLRYFVRSRKTVTSLATRGDISFREVSGMVTKKQKERIIAVCKTMLENTRDENLPNFHDQYYQASILYVFLPETGKPVPESEFSPGQILQIYFDQDSTETVRLILESLKQQVCNVRNPLNVYPGLTLPNFDHSTCICQNREPFGNIFDTDPTDETPKRCDFLECENLAEAQRLLVLAQGLSMIVVDKIRIDADTGEVTGVNNWKRMMSAILSTDDLFLVFLIQVEDFDEIGETDNSEVRALVNMGLSNEQRQNVICLDVTANRLEAHPLV